MTQAYEKSGGMMEQDLRHTVRTEQSSQKQLFRQDGTPIKKEQVRQTKGFAPSEFNKHDFGKQITLRYDKTNFRPEFLVAPTREDTSVTDQDSLQGSSLMHPLMPTSPSVSGYLAPNKHMMHRTEDIHRPDSRAFLKDPMWKRDDIYASFLLFRENQLSPEVGPSTYFYRTR